ncbi:MAG: flagellar motor switch protein FliG [Gemmatimonadales bacterium]|nr:MAG: flagellar motor switch protein FliG [Gemmatimonadales bacterium]
MPTSSVVTTGLPGEEIPGPRKAAILLMALGDDVSSKITRHLPPEEVEALSYEIARMDRVEPALVEKVLEEWEQTERAAQFVAEGGTDFARRILTKAFGQERADQILSRIEVQLSETLTLAPLQKADPQQVAGLIRNEHPQTMALVLAHLDAQQAGFILKELDSRKASGILMRMALVDKVLPEVLQVVERVLGAGGEVSLSQGGATRGGPIAVASVLNELVGGLEKELLDQMSEVNPELAQEIKDLMFVFEDILKLDDDAVTRIMREVDVRDMATALKVASEPLKEKMLGVMTTRARDALTEEMEFMGPVRMREVEEAQGKVVGTIRSLEEAGEIVVSGGRDVMVG